MRWLNPKAVSAFADLHLLESAPEESIELPDPGIIHYSVKKGERVRKACNYYKLSNVYLSYSDTFNYKTDWAIYSEDKKSIILMGDKAPYIIDDSIYVNRLLFLEDQYTKFNVCHFIFDKLGRAFDLRKYCPESSNVFIAKHNRYIEFFLNINGLRNVYRGTSGSYFVKELFISSDSWVFNHPGRLISDCLLEGIKVMSSRICASGQEKIFLTRRNEASRRLLNESNVIYHLGQLGFSVIDPGELLPVDQIALFAGAKQIVGVHGAGLTGLAFARERARVVEIVPPLCATPAYHIVASRMGHSYQAVLAADPDGIVPDYTVWQHNPKDYNGKDVVVDVDLLLSSLEKDD